MIYRHRNTEDTIDQEFQEHVLSLPRQLVQSRNKYDQVSTKIDNICLPGYSSQQGYQSPPSSNKNARHSNLIKSAEQPNRLMVQALVAVAPRSSKQQGAGMQIPRTRGVWINAARNTVHTRTRACSYPPPRRVNPCLGAGRGPGQENEP